MAVFSGANIVNDGLVFHYDMDNTQKSWKGAPTTNLLTNPLDPENWNHQRNTDFGFISDEYFTYNGPLGKNIPAYRRTVTGTDFRAVRFDTPWIAHTQANLSLPITGSIYGRCLDPASNTRLNINFQGTNSSGSRVDTNTSLLVTDDWTLLSDTRTLSNNNFVSLVNFGMKYYMNGDSTPRTWEFMMPQVEQLNVASPFINGTRSDTEAVLDITGNNTFTANNLTYNNNNTFQFSSGNITIPFSNDFDFSKEQTIVMWMKPGTGSNSARRNPYNQAYGGSGTITHETSQAFTYFFGTHGGNSTPYQGRNSSFTVGPNELAFIAVTRNQDTNTVRWYKNGNLISTQNAGGYAATNNGSSPILIGTGYTTNFIGEISKVLVYKKELTPIEINQIFEATRSRYGI
jgi:hypothetical protein